MALPRKSPRTPRAMQFHRRKRFFSDSLDSLAAGRGNATDTS
ncbi:hypothetical protein [Luteimonas sp. BDR2-5]|nr:hypothetical protein [Luteimonas sp. BDR2-5]